MYEKKDPIQVMIDILVEEKKLVYQEKLALIKVSKSVITLVIPFLAFLINVAQNAEALYLIIPFVICAIATFLYSNEHTQNLVYEYLNRLDHYMAKLQKVQLPFYQNIVGEIMADSEGYKWYFPNPYVFFSIALSLVIIPIYVFSTIQGHQYLYNHHFYWWDVAYSILSYTLLLLIILYGFYFGTKFKSIREKVFNRKMNLDLFAKYD